ncbi:hypothetical protein IG631_14372 [Alternaria alternata]|nr:hypothetical protein IG631_14372 [Alternaria alternata]
MAKRLRDARAFRRAAQRDPSQLDRIFYDWDDWSEVEWLGRLQMRFFETRTVEQLQAMTTVTVSGHVDVLNIYIHYRGNVASWFDFLPPMSGKASTLKWKSLQKQLGAKCTGLDF